MLSIGSQQKVNGLGALEVPTLHERGSSTEVQQRTGGVIEILSSRNGPSGKDLCLVQIGCYYCCEGKEFPAHYVHGVVGKKTIATG
jgi:hypothetical protein